jgi:hypothetical protein
MTLIVKNAVAYHRVGIFRYNSGRLFHSIIRKYIASRPYPLRVTVTLKRTFVIYLREKTFTSPKKHRSADYPDEIRATKISSLSG